jgi:nucleoside-diphosphate-sugar epimerase
VRITFVGGTGPVGTAARRVAIAAGHEVVVAHTGEHEGPPDLPSEHVHEAREALLAPDGPLARSRPDAIVDTRTTERDAAAVLECARLAGAGRLIAVSSTDVYQYFVDAAAPDLAGYVAMPRQTVPVDEDAPLRTSPYPWAEPGHDNAAMERALRAAMRLGEAVSVVRPGMIYGPGAAGREWSIVRLVKLGIRRIDLPAGGGQFFARAAVERVGRAIVSCAERGPRGFWVVNAVDPYGWTYAGLAAEIGELLRWEWEPRWVEWSAARHPWKVQCPYVCADRRLREDLGVLEPDPRAALAETVAWLWQQGEAAYGLDEPGAPSHRGPEREPPATR